METYFSNMAAKDGSPRKIVRDLRTLVTDTESLLKHGCVNLSRSTCIAAKESKAAILRRPYHSVSFAFGVGVFLGLLLTRK